MTPAERRLWDAVQRRAGRSSPDMAGAIERAYQTIRDALTDDEIEQAIASGSVDQLITDALVRTATQPLRDEIRQAIASGFTATGRDTPLLIGAEVRAVFNMLSPHVITGIRTLETKVVTTLAEDTRAVVRAAVEQALREGQHPRVAARSLRSVIGLGPSQLQEVQNYRDALLGLNGRAVTDYTLRDKRFDRTVAKGDLPEAQAEKMVAAYAKKRIAQNAATVALTAALDAQKLGQRLAWEAAIENGTVSRSAIRKTWVGVMDARERPTHRAMEGVTVGFDDLFSLPDGEQQLIPGDTEYRCRCLAKYTAT